MQLLISSADLDDLERVVKRLVWARIPCAVCKDPVTAFLSVWIQRDADFPLALRAVMNRNRRSQLPDWARALEPPLPATKRSALPTTKEMVPGQGRQAPSKVPTWTGTARVTTLLWGAQTARLARLSSWPLPGANSVSGPSEEALEPACG
jgi:hypothetical protein